MKSCHGWREPLLDCALGASAPPELLAHLAVCPECARLLAEWRSGAERLDSAVRQLVHSEPAPNLGRRVLARIQAKPAKAGWPAGWKAALAAAALAALFSLSFYAFRTAATRREEARKLTSAAVALSRWRSPTDALLRPPVDPLFKSTPKLGEGFFEMHLPAEGRRKIGGKNED